MTESTAEVAYRLKNETECRRIAELINRELAPGLVFVLVTATVGEDGAFSNCSYVSTANRDDAARLLTEMIDHWRESVAANVVEPTVRTATMMREAIFGRLRDVPWQRLLHGARASIRNAEAAFQLKNTRAAKVETLKAATELLAVFDQLQRPIQPGGN